jgi:hypothetical protein
MGLARAEGNRGRSSMAAVVLLRVCVEWGYAMDFAVDVEIRIQNVSRIKTLARYSI